MRNLTKGTPRRLAALLTLCTALILSVTLSACGASNTGSQTPETPREKTPGEVAVLYLKGMAGDISGLKAHNPDSSVTADAIFGGVNKATLESLGVTATSEQEEQLSEAMHKGLSKVEIELVDEKVTGSTAKVTLAVKGIDLASSFKTRYAAIDKTKITDDASKAEATVAALADAWSNAPLLTEPTTVDMVLNYPPGVKSGGMWTPDASSAKGLSSAIVKVA
jgi:hypothetical protein